VSSTQAATASDVRPFQVEVWEVELEDLRRRIKETRWPEKEPVDDQSQGVQLATIQKAPRSWSEQAYPNLIYFNEVDEGNHFAAWQEPEIFTSELRAAFKSLR
jgi:Epoxide hydrolase N terminus